ncbi:MAG: hypothetical protein ACYC55_08395 [Candidatus Geothermincolia bacterium]
MRADLPEGRLTRAERFGHVKQHRRKRHARRFSLIRRPLEAVMTRPLLWASLSLCVVIALGLVSLAPGAGTPEDLRSSLAFSGADLEVRGASLAERAVQQRNQIHMEESTQPGDVPYQEIWVLNDPFFPLIGNAGVLRDNEGRLDSKLGYMLRRPTPEAPTTQELDPGGYPVGGAAPTTQTTTGATLGLSSQKGDVVLVEEIRESRGIMYARIKVGGQTYSDVRAGVVFADTYQVSEFKDRETLILLCGDERYEMKVGQLRRI